VLHLREADRDLVLGGGAAFVAKRQSSGPARGIGGGGSSAGLTPEAVEKNLEVIAAGSTPKLPTKLAKILKKRSGQMSIALEYKRRADDTDDVNHVDFRRYSVKLRELKMDVLFGELHGSAALCEQALGGCWVAGW
jgi:hypothetical protein